jgi:hypothetical protein
VRALEDTIRFDGRTQNKLAVADPTAADNCARDLYLSNGAIQNTFVFADNENVKNL